MSIDYSHITISGLDIEIVRKSIKNLHLGIYPPMGHIRVAAPKAISDDAIRLAVISRLAWIKRHQRRFRAQERQSLREYTSGETHFFWGRSYRLRVIHKGHVARITLEGLRSIIYQIPANYSDVQKEAYFLSWYRRELREAALPILKKWAAIMGVSEPDLRIKHMKTKWGSYSSKNHRIWLNLELAKKAPQCLEYLIVHEMTHYFERHHNERFTKLLDTHIPQWRLFKDELNALPLKHEHWRLSSKLTS